MGYMNFGIKSNKAGVKLNPFTGEKIKVAACKVPKFKFGKSFKAIFNA